VLEQQVVCPSWQTLAMKTETALPGSENVRTYIDKKQITTHIFTKTTCKVRGFCAKNLAMLQKKV